MTLSPRLRFFPALVALVALSASPLAQDRSTAVVRPGHDTAAHESLLRARARDLAASTADEALKWDDDKISVQVLTRAADLLWKERPARAKDWLMGAWVRANKLKDEGEGDALRRFRQDPRRAEARATVLAVAQRHDRKLADHLLDQLADEKERSTYESRRGAFDDRSARSEQLLSLSLAAVESDPDAAARLAEQSLADGVSFQLQSVLLALRARDRAAADRVFDAALFRLATHFAHPNEGQVIASYLFTPGRVFSVDSSNTLTLVVSPNAVRPERTPAESDPARARRFLCIMQRRLLSMPAPSTTTDPARSAQEFVTLVNSLSNGFKAYAPDLWTAVEHRLALVIPDLTPAKTDGRLPSAVRERLRSGDPAAVSEEELNRLYVDGLEEDADKETDPLARKLAYTQAALATAPENLTRGRRLAEKIDEDALRAQVVSLLIYRAALFNLEKGRVDTAIELASEAKPVHRAVILTAAAQKLVADQSEAREVDNRLRALELLHDAERLLRREDSADALRVRLGVVAALAQLDGARALESLDEVVASINKIAAFDPTDANAPRLADLKGMAAYLSLPRVRSGYGLKDVLGPLARTNFHVSVDVTNKLTSPTVRGFCLMEIAQSVLTERPSNQAALGNTSLPTDSATFSDVSMTSGPQPRTGRRGLVGGQIPGRPMQ